MPNKAKDPKCNDKKRHIGNNFVTIVYNNSGEEYDISTIRCQFTHACVIVEPLEMGTNYAFIKGRPEVAEMQYYAQEKTLISDVNLALFVRQLAVHANVSLRKCFKFPVYFPRMLLQNMAFGSCNLNCTYSS